MTDYTYHCFVYERKLSLSFDANSNVSLISASVVYNLNLPCIFEISGLPVSSADLSVPTVGGAYVSQMNLVVSYDLASDVLLGSDWLLPCQPVFTDGLPFLSNPPPETVREISPPHKWEPTSGLFVHSIPFPCL